MSPDKEAEFARYCKERFSPPAVVFAGSTLLCALGWWPVSSFVFRALPGYLPMTLSYLVWVAAIGVIFGHTSFLLLRSNFFQATLLTENDLLLEARVAERTRELRELLSRLETTREEERGRIAREVHDQIGQELTAQRLTLAIAEECVDGEPTTARRKLVEMEGLLDRMMGTVRALVADLRPWILHDLGLGEAARWLARRTEDLSGLRCELSLSGDPQHLDPERSTAAFRILQESLNNVTKHAQATSVAIDITTTASLLVLRIQDDGIGPRRRRRCSAPCAPSPRARITPAPPARARRTRTSRSRTSTSPRGRTRCSCGSPRAAR